jgi:predicted DNA-binding transcriptional regulator YafY
MDRQGAQRPRRGAALAGAEGAVGHRAPAARRLAPDLEACCRPRPSPCTAGPRPFEEESVLAAVREALKSLSTLRFRYEGGSTPGARGGDALRHPVRPLELPRGRGAAPGPARATGASTASRRRGHGDGRARPEDFSLQAYADESFGIYQDDTEDVVLRVLPEGREDAPALALPRRQTVEEQDDGSVIVRFRASGMRELAWHLFTWAPQSASSSRRAAGDEGRAGGARARRAAESR